MCWWVSTIWCSAFSWRSLLRSGVSRAFVAGLFLGPEASKRLLEGELSSFSSKGTSLAFRLACPIARGRSDGFRELRGWQGL